MMQEGRVKYAFIILHYQSYEETIQCVESIKRIDGSNSSKIVVVDNASPNESGKMLEQRWDTDPNVLVVLNEENVGFSAANNMGCRIARDNWNPKYYIIANNDIVFEQANFLDKIASIDEEEEFYVLGPDIYSARTKVHQSPYALESPTRNQVRKTIALNSICLALFDIVYPVLQKYYERVEIGVHDSIGYAQKQVGIVPMGACLIFSERYIEKSISPFTPETYFYYEENILTTRCMKEDWKIVYSPMIRVLHLDGVATRAMTVSKEAARFRMKNIRDAAKVYFEYLKK